MIGPSGPMKAHHLGHVHFLSKRTLVCIFQFHNFCRKIALLKVNWGFMHHTLEIGSSSPPHPPLVFEQKLE